MKDRIHLPAHGRIQCSICHQPQPYSFDRTRTDEDGWRITNNPMAWGGSEPEVVVLGFSKGPTQAGALSSSPHETIAYKGGRSAVAKILHHIGLLERADARIVDSLIASPDGPIHFASLIRCTVERRDEKEGAWKGTGGGMLDRFVATNFGRRISENCGTRFLSGLPEPTRLVVMLGLGSKLNYVRACRSLFERIRPGQWHDLNEVSYTDGTITVVHTEHFASQGALLPNWLSSEGHDRGQLGLLARAAVASSGVLGLSAEAEDATTSHSTGALWTAPKPENKTTTTVPTTSSQAEASVAKPITAQPAAVPTADAMKNTLPLFVFRPEHAQAYGRPLPDGSFLVCAGSTAMRSGSPNVKRDVADRDVLVRKGILVPDTDPAKYRFAIDHVFGSSSKAAGIIRDGNASGPSLWKDVETGRTLRDYLANT